MRFLITGAAGFIGMHAAQRLLRDGHDVVGLDAFTPYYDPTLKRARFALLTQYPRFAGCEASLEDAPGLRRLVQEAAPDVVIHLAAQAGVRYSIDEPGAYIGANIVGTFNLLEAVRAHPAKHLLIASTSSVYGANSAPFRETDRADHPLSIYAATKKATEDMAHSYAHLFNQPMTLMRFFTVYGPWGRPDMALFRFTKSILAGEAIDVYNAGRMSRDFTYVDDVVEAIARLVSCAPKRGDIGASPVAPCRVVNIAGGAPVWLDDYIATIESATGRTALRRDLPMQAGDVTRTDASVELLATLTGFTPKVRVDTGVKAFVEWYRQYYAV